ncbi:MAG TPA: hypothetical protein VFJ16_25930 [Longimicrobium sp.]|nr:hypothetical protein [Longimicrobium sp.]
MENPIVLDLGALQVESFDVAPALSGESGVPTQRTFERDCTMPGLCPETTTTA